MGSGWASGQIYSGNLKLHLSKPFDVHLGVWKSCTSYLYWLGHYINFICKVKHLKEREERRWWHRPSLCEYPGQRPCVRAWGVGLSLRPCPGLCSVQGPTLAVLPLYSSPRLGKCTETETYKPQTCVPHPWLPACCQLSSSTQDWKTPPLRGSPDGLGMEKREAQDWRLFSPPRGALAWHPKQSQSPCLELEPWSF